MKPKTLDQRRTGTAAVITGASGCLGRELAILFSTTGHVILSGRSEPKLNETRSKCADPANTTIVCGSLADSGVLARLAYFANLYSVQYLICSAGEYLNLQLDETIPHGGDSIIESNLTATINIVQHVLPVFRITGSGVIVNINSLAGKNPSPNEAIYSASKHGLSGFFKALRLEQRQSGVRVLDIYLGALRSDLMRSRPDYDYLIDPKEAAYTIHRVATSNYGGKPTLQIEDMTIGRFAFP